MTPGFHPKTNIVNQIYHSESMKPNLPNQIQETKPTKPNPPWRLLDMKGSVDSIAASLFEIICWADKQYQRTNSKKHDWYWSEVPCLGKCATWRKTQNNLIMLRQATSWSVDPLAMLFNNDSKGSHPTPTLLKNDLVLSKCKRHCETYST